MDGLSELLRAIRLTATAYIEAQLSAPWAVETPPRSAIAPTKLIAESAGFGSTAAFTRAFKREFGVPPVAWRRRRRKAAGTQTV